MEEPTTQPQPAPRSRFMRSLALSAAILLALLGAAEAALRTDFVFTRLPMPRPYYSPDVLRRLHYLELLERERGPIDVLFVGSSVVRAGIQPGTFDRAVKQATGKPVVSFNGGFSKMYPSGARLYLEHVWLEHTQPRFVFHGVRANELSSSGGPSYLKHGLIESLWFDRSPLAPYEAKLLTKSRLLQYRGTLNTVLKRWSQDDPLHVARETGEMGTDTNGYRKESGTLASKKKGKSKRLWRYDEPLKANEYERAFKAIGQMLKVCRRAGTQYVLVNMPEHPERFSHERGPATWTHYQEHVQAWAKEQGVPYLDVTFGDYNSLSDDRMYVDYHHLSARGAKEMTERLARLAVPLLEQQP